MIYWDHCWKVTNISYVDIEDIGVNTLHNSAGSRMQSFSAPPNIS